jgi:prefoldin subunit 5
MDVNIVINILQRKVSELTLANTMLEAKVLDLTTKLDQLNTINQEKPSENAINGNEDQTQKLNDGISDTDKPRST